MDAKIKREKQGWLTQGHTTDLSSFIAHSFVVSRESVQIVLTIATLNGLDILACGSLNGTMICTIAGDGFGFE